MLGYRGQRELPHYPGMAHHLSATDIAEQTGVPLATNASAPEDEVCDIDQDIGHSPGLPDIG